MYAVMVGNSPHELGCDQSLNNVMAGSKMTGYMHETQYKLSQERAIWFPVSVTQGAFLASDFGTAQPSRSQSGSVAKIRSARIAFARSIIASKTAAFSGFAMCLVHWKITVGRGMGQDLDIFESRLFQHRTDCRRPTRVERIDDFQVRGHRCFVLAPPK